MTWRSDKKLFAALVTVALAVWSPRLVVAAEAKRSWQLEWEKTLQAAKKEGQVAVYIYRYEPVLEAFRKEYPEIKMVSVTGTGNQLGLTIISERRAEKYLADIFSGGPNSNFNILYKGKALDPLKCDSSFLFKNVNFVHVFWSGPLRDAIDHRTCESHNS